MPVLDPIYAGTYDSQVQNTSTTAWATARGGSATNGNSVYGNEVESSDFGVYNAYTGARGTNTFYCRRSYFPFDVSGVEGTLDSATIKIYMENLGDTGDEAEVQLREATALANTAADFGNAWHHGTLLGDQIAPKEEPPASAAYVTFTLGTSGLSVLEGEMGSSTMVVGLMGFKYDVTSSSAPSLNGDLTKVKVYYSDHSTSAFHPRLDITVKATGNSVFFGANF